MRAGRKPMDPSADNKTPLSNRVFLLLCCMAFIMYVDRANISIVAPLFKKELALTNTELGLVFSAFAVAYACCGVPGAWLSDRYGARLAFTASGLVWSAATIVTGLAYGLPAIVAARFFVGAGEAPIYATAARVISVWIPEQRRGLAQGVMHGSGRLANALAPVIVTALIVLLTWRIAFVALGLVTILFFAFLYWWFRDEPREHPAIGASELAVLSGTSGQLTQGRTLGPIVWPDLLRRVWPASLTCFAHGWMLWFFLNWIPTYFSTRYGLKIESSAIFSTLVLLGGTLGTMAGGVLSDWHFRKFKDRLRARRDVIIFGFLSSIVGLLPLLFSNDLTLNAAGLGLAFFLSELADSPLWLVGAEISPKHAGTSSALTFAGMAVAGAVSPLIIGKLLDATGGDWSSAFMASIGVMILGPIASLFIRLDPSLDGDAVGVDGREHPAVADQRPDVSRAPIG
jgi:MFS family permease